MLPDRSENPASGSGAVQSTVAGHWQANPVDENVFARLDEFGGDYDAYFSAYDKWRYAKQGHILAALDRFDWQGKRVLEIGLGQGSDSEQLIRRGARWSGIDLTEESVSRLARRLEIRQLPFERLVRGSATELPFEDASFDIVFSHGVLHHIPRIDLAQHEIRRVLRDDGRLVAMFYARHSLNYHVAIRIVRRLGLVLAYYLPISGTGIVAEHRRLAHEVGLGTVFANGEFRSSLHRWAAKPLLEAIRPQDPGRRLPGVRAGPGVQAVDARSAAADRQAARRIAARLAPVGGIQATPMIGDEPVV